MENFNLDKINEMPLQDAKIYLTTYFAPLSNGDHTMLVNGKYEIKKITTLKKVYFNRMSKDLNTYYFKEHICVNHN